MGDLPSANCACDWFLDSILHYAHCKRLASIFILIVHIFSFPTQLLKLSCEARRRLRWDSLWRVARRPVRRATFGPSCLRETLICLWRWPSLAQSQRWVGKFSVLLMFLCFSFVLNVTFIEGDFLNWLVYDSEKCLDVEDDELIKIRFFKLNCLSYE